MSNMDEQIYVLLQGAGATIVKVGGSKGWVGD